MSLKNLIQLLPSGPSAYTDAATLNSITDFSGVDVHIGAVYTDAGTITSTSSITGTESVARTDTATINPIGTFSGTESRVVVDLATFNPLTAFSGLDHYCIYVPLFDVSAQTEFDVEEGNARTNYHLGVQKRFYVTAELSPGANPC